MKNRKCFNCQQYTKAFKSIILGKNSSFLPINTGLRFYCRKCQLWTWQNNNVSVRIGKWIVVQYRNGLYAHKDKQTIKLGPVLSIERFMAMTEERLKLLMLYT